MGNCNINKGKETSIKIELHRTKPNFLIKLQEKRERWISKPPENCLSVLFVDILSASQRLASNLICKFHLNSYKNPGSLDAKTMSPLWEPRKSRRYCLVSRITSGWKNKSSISNNWGCDWSPCPTEHQLAGYHAETYVKSRHDSVGPIVAKSSLVVSLRWEH